MQTNLNDKIKHLRKARGLTQAQLGAKLNKSGSAVKMWELGRSYPDAETLVVLAQFFGVSTDYLLSADVILEVVPDVVESPVLTPEEKQISKINKELGNLNVKQLKIVNDLLREIRHDDNE